MKIFDPAGNLFKSFEGKWPNTQAVWDGKGISGDLVDSAEDYAVAATVRDEFGNSAVLKTTIPVDILVEKTPTGYRILSSRIFFKAFTADYVHVAPDLAKQNVVRLDQLATKLKKFPGYKITLVGHAVMINWDNPAEGKEEQKDILIPLSKARADAVKKAMVDRGFDPAMISTEGVGASDQLVPDTTSSTAGGTAGSPSSWTSPENGAGQGLRSRLSTRLDRGPLRLRLARPGLGVRARRSRCG